MTGTTAWPPPNLKRRPRPEAADVKMSPGSVEILCNVAALDATDPGDYFADSFDADGDSILAASSAAPCAVPVRIQVRRGTSREIAIRLLEKAVDWIRRDERALEGFDCDREGQW